MLDSVRCPLLEEACRSPDLLSDLAGWEQYVAESYNARSFVELLQNADDAGAARLTIRRESDFLLVANDGREFSAADLSSLCRSASSNKIRGTTIGYRGIGFKSVVGVAETIHVFSGQLEATFSRERTASDVPQATRVPLIRIPHHVSREDKQHFHAAVKDLRSEGYRTIFVFTDLVASGIETEFSDFDPSSLLFLHNTRQVELRTGMESLITVRRETVTPQIRRIRLATADAVIDWVTIDGKGVTLAFRCDAGGIVPLSEREAVVHAFLPTLEPTGFPLKINGDISTDPSRTRVVLDERTTLVAGLAADMLLHILETLVLGASKILGDQLSPLVPFSDPRLAYLHRHSFKTVLLNELQKRGRERFRQIRIRPSWLNPSDFSTVMSESGVLHVPGRVESTDGLDSLLRFVGAQESRLETFGPALSKIRVSAMGSAEVVASLASQFFTKRIDSTLEFDSWMVWFSGGEGKALRQLRTNPLPLDRDFIDLLVERGLSTSQLSRFLTELTGPELAAALVGLSNDQAGRAPSDDLPPLGSWHAPGALSHDDGDPNPPLNRARHSEAEPYSVQQNASFSLKRWRSAEQQVAALLVAQGWVVTDVSRQNLGYDLSAEHATRPRLYVEVKSIDYPGEPFTLTSNEEVVSRQFGKDYCIALVRQTGEFLEVAMLSDPSRTLSLVRQCRQWVWECSQYEFAPLRIAVV